jgi:hypothetical protein
MSSYIVPEFLVAVHRFCFQFVICPEGFSLRRGGFQLRFSHVSGVFIRSQGSFIVLVRLLCYSQQIVKLN